MTDAEIKKALECHADSDLASCKECPLLNIQDCCYLLSKETFDLINRQKAEIESLRKAILDGDYSSITALNAKENWYMENSKHIEQLNIWNDRLIAENEELRCVIGDLSNNMEQAKAEAIKEFAQSVKDLAYKKSHSDKEIYAWYEDIDSLVKEMVGDTE